MMLVITFGQVTFMMDLLAQVVFELLMLTYRGNVRKGKLTILHAMPFSLLLLKGYGKYLEQFNDISYSDFQFIKCYLYRVFCYAMHFLYLTENSLDDN